MSIFNKIDSRILLLFLLFIVVRLVSFNFFGYIQEDAFIYLRIAENLSRHGEYAYNLGENVSAATSHIYLFLMAAVSRFFEYQGTFIIMNVINSIFQFFSVLIWGRLLFKKDSDMKIFLLVMTFIPVSLTVSSIGMETSLLIFLFTLGFYFVKKNKFKNLVFVLLILPLIRPDAIFFSFLLSFSYYFYNRKAVKNSIYLLIISIVGVLLLLLFNHILFDVYINQTVIAKQVAYKLSYSISDIYSRVFNNLNHAFVPITFSFIKNIVFTIFFFTIFIFSLRKMLIIRKDKVLVLFVFSVSVGLPIIYGIKATTFPWYLMPATFMIYVSISYALVQMKHIYIYKPAITVLLFVLFLSELLFLKNIAMKEDYRTDIGIYIKSITNKNATMFLEPIGYIPYFAQRYVYCEVGLVTPEVTEYRKKYGNQNYHKYFLKDKMPTIIVSRPDLFNINKETGDWGVDQEWMKDNYVLKKHFIYKNRDTKKLNSLERILDKYFGRMSDFYVYMKK